MGHSRDVPVVEEGSVTQRCAEQARCALLVTKGPGRWTVCDGCGTTEPRWGIFREPQHVPVWPEPDPEPGSPEALAFQSAMDLLAEERWGEAKAAFLSALEHGDKRISRCNNGIGLCLSLPPAANNEDLEAALEHFERAVEVAPENYGAWHNKAHTLERLGRVDEANATEKATEQMEQDPAASLGLEGSAEEDAAAAKLQARQRGRQDRARVAELKAAQSSAAEGSGTGLISARGVRISGPLTSYSAMFFKAMPDLWHPESNPEGYIIFAAAENKLGYAHVKPLFDEAAQDFPHGELTTPMVPRRMSLRSPLTPTRAVVAGRACRLRRAGRHTAAEGRARGAHVAQLRRARVLAAAHDLRGRLHAVARHVRLLHLRRR